MQQGSNWNYFRNKKSHFLERDFLLGTILFLVLRDLV